MLKRKLECFYLLWIATTYMLDFIYVFDNNTRFWEFAQGNSKSKELKCSYSKSKPLDSKVDLNFKFMNKSSNLRIDLNFKSMNKSSYQIVCLSLKAQEQIYKQIYEQISDSKVGLSLKIKSQVGGGKVEIFICHSWLGERGENLKWFNKITPGISNTSQLGRLWLPMMHPFVPIQKYFLDILTYYILLPSFRLNWIIH